jgi:hypothetical protein
MIVTSWQERCWAERSNVPIRSVKDAKPGPDGALGIVLMRERRPEDGHHRVTDELLDRAAVALDLLAQASVVGTDAGANVLRVSRFRGGSEANEIAEEDGHDLALLANRRCRLPGQRRRTERAEGELTRQLFAACGAGRHPPSLGRLFRRRACEEGVEKSDEGRKPWAI